MAGPPLPVPVGGDQTKAPMIIGVFSALTAISALAIAARLYTRLRLLRSPGVDDIVIVFSFILVLLNLAILSHATTLGLGRHVYYLEPHNELLAVKWDFIGDPFGIMGVAVPKLAVLLFLHRIVGKTKRYQIWGFYFLVVTLLIFSALDAIFLFVQCSPAYASWTPTVPHTCWNPKIVEDFSLFVGAYSAFTDFALASFPLVVIYNLQMSGKRRIAISVVMSLGVFAGICAIVRTTKLASLANYADWTWRAGDSIIWTAAEMNVIIICACVPALLPLVQQITGQKDYLDRPSRNTDDPVASRRPFWSIGLRSLKSRGTKNGLATRLETLDGNVRDGEIRHTTNIQTEWEAV